MTQLISKEKMTAMKNGGPAKAAQSESAPVENAESARPPISKLELKALFEAYTKADEAVALAAQNVDIAVRKRSDCVKEISEKGGNGPYRFQGIKTTIMARVKKSTGEVTYFLRQPAEEDALIDV